MQLNIAHTFSHKDSIIPANNKAIWRFETFELSLGWIYTHTNYQNKRLNSKAHKGEKDGAKRRWWGGVIRDLQKVFLFLCMIAANGNAHEVHDHEVIGRRSLRVWIIFITRYQRSFEIYCVLLWNDWRLFWTSAHCNSALLTMKTYLCFLIKSSETIVHSETMLCGLCVASMTIATAFFAISLSSTLLQKSFRSSAQNREKSE